MVSMNNQFPATVDSFVFSCALHYCLGPKDTFQTKNDDKIMDGFKDTVVRKLLSF